jgi:hypothetical protein
MALLTEIIEKSITEYESIRKVYKEYRQTIADRTLTFWKQISAELETVSTSNLNNFFYDNISDYFIDLHSYFGQDISEAGNNINEFFLRFIRNVISNTTDTYSVIKYNVFYSYFSSTVLGLTEESASVDSAKTLRIVDFYSVSDITKQTPGFKQISPRASLNISRFEKIYKTKVLKYINELSTHSSKINKAISDGEPEQIKNPIWDIEPEALKQSWAHEGEKLAYDLKQIKSALEGLGGMEASASGDLEVVAEVSKIMNLVCFSTKNGTYSGSIINNKNYFGNFYELYSAKKQPSRIYGLKFLEPFLNLKSFNTINPKRPEFANKLIQKFYNGLPEREGISLSYDSEQTLTGVFEVIKVGLFSILQEAQNVGGILNNTLNSLRSNGSLENYAGLGNIKYILEMLQDLFPAAISGRSGFIGALDYFAKSLLDLEANISQASLNNDFIESLVPFLLKVQSHLDSFVSTIEITGTQRGALISSINADLSKKSKRDIVEYLRRNSVQNVDFLSEVQSFDEVLEAYGEILTDSQDLKSFFKAYDLMEYMYILGGDSAIFSFMDFINNPNISNTRRIYEFLERNLTKYEHVDRFKFGKLVGSLLNINRATNFEAFKSYSSILKAKNSDIFESLKFLDSLQINPLKSPNEVDILNDFINQLSSGSYEYRIGDIGCHEAMKVAPLVVKNFVGMFDSALGSANKSLVQGFLNNNFGITMSELETYFRTSYNPGLTTLGGLISGIRGGGFTHLAKHLVLSGALINIRSVSNKYRYEVVDDIYIRELVAKLENISRLMSLVYNRLLLGFDNNNEVVVSRSSNNIQNIAYYPLSRVAEFFNSSPPPAPSGNIPPGLGGSPNIVRVLGQHIQPEGTNVLSAPLAPISAPRISKYTPTQSDIGRSFIKSDVYNEVASGFEQKLAKVFSQALNSTTSDVPPVEFVLANSSEYKKKYLSSIDLEPSALGGHTIKPRNPKTSLELCQRFGGVNCEQESADPVYLSTEGNISVQREFLNISEINPSKVFIPNIYKAPPRYFGVLIGADLIGLLGEPASSSQKISEVSFDEEKAGLHYDYAHTSYAILEFSKELRRDFSEIKDCMSFEKDLSKYTKCVNYIRCRKAPSDYKFCS